MSDLPPVLTDRLRPGIMGAVTGGRRVWGLLLGVVVALTVSAPAGADPARVILFRHAEKPTDQNDIHLSEPGRERARKLVEFFASKLGITTNEPPAALFATRPTRGAASLRTRETLEPLATALKLPIQAPEKAADFSALARHLLESRRYHGKTVVVCWVHDELGDFARALGAKPKPKDWKRDDFDRVWVIAFKTNGIRCKTVLQQLLPGDASE